MIFLEKVSKSFHKGEPGQIKAVSGIDLKIDSGEFVIVVGANGSGKSTLLNLIAGTESIDSGKIFLEKEDISKYPDYERSKWIARIFQNPLTGTASELSILENFRLAALRTEKKGLRIGTGNEFRDLVRDHISGLELGLENKIDQLMGTLSGGQRQALTLLMAVFAETKILLLDEPTAALDPKTSRVIMNLAEKLIREKEITALLISHHLKDITEYGDRVIQMMEGEVIRDLKGEEKSGLSLNELYNWFGD